MSKSFMGLIIVILVGGFGGYWYIHKDDNRLRMDVCEIRSKQGPLSESTTIDALDRLSMRVTLRGCTADSSSMCKATVTAKVEGPKHAPQFEGRGRGGEMVELNKMPPLEFRKNSPITSMEVTSAAEAFPPGDYKVTIIAEDLVAQKKVEKEFKFSAKM